MSLGCASSSPISQICLWTSEVTLCHKEERSMGHRAVFSDEAGFVGFQEALADLWILAADRESDA